MDLQELAAVTRAVLGGDPSRVVYHGVEDTVAVSVLAAVDQPEVGVTSWATVGMSAIGNRWRTDDGRAVRIELLAAARSEHVAMGAALAGCAFNVAAGDYVAAANVIFPDVIAVNDPTVGMKHAMLTAPFLWSVPTPDGQSGRVTRWLQVVPVDDAEFEFARRYGVDMLQGRLLKERIDVYNLNRASAV
jgi:hypothetical protein